MHLCVQMWGGEIRIYNHICSYAQTFWKDTEKRKIVEEKWADGRRRASFLESIKNIHHNLSSSLRKVKKSAWGLREKRISADN